MSPSENTLYLTNGSYLPILHMYTLPKGKGRDGVGKKNTLKSIFESLRVILGETSFLVKESTRCQIRC